MRFLATLVLFGGSFSGTGPLFGQRILYNQDLDTKGKAAGDTAKKLTASTVTDKELQNLAVLEKAQIDRVLSDATVTMRRDIEALSTWGSATQLITSIQTNIMLVNLATLEIDENSGTATERSE